jgi:hypothetical protein
VDVPGGDEVLERPAALVLVLDEHRVAGGGGDHRMAADPGLDARLLVGADDELVVLEPAAGPLAGVEVEDARRLRPEVGVPGKIQLRWVQGLIASSLSQRQTVVSLIEATNPRRITSARMSGTWSRLKGSPRRAGSSQAIALTATTSSGGKTRPAAGPRALRQARQALLEEALPPLRYALDRQVEPAGDLGVLLAVRGEEHDPSPDDITIRC